MPPTSFPTRLLSRFLLPALLCALPANASAQQVLSEAHPLKVGQYLWAENFQRPGDLSMVVSIAQQRLYVYRGGNLIGMSTVSTGARGHETPLGDFTVLQKNMWHRSNLYSNAPMPYMQRLTWTGIAIHGGHLPGYPASHGCIRLPNLFAKQLFAISSLGVPVTIVDAHKRPLVKLQFADIDWLLDDDTLSVPPARLLPARSDADLIDERVQPRPAAGPHWAPVAEREAMRSGRRAPKLEFERLPE